MADAISPKYLDTDFPLPWSLDQKIDIFTDRVNGWQIDIAQQCADKISGSGFAVLSIVCSCFEMIAKFKEGYTGEGKSPDYFKKGINEFLLRFPDIKPDLRDKLALKLYQGVRCALYHTGITKRVNLSGDYLTSIEFPEPYDKVNINPHKLVPDIKEYFGYYIQELKNPDETTLRKNFEARFDFQRK